MTVNDLPGVQYARDVVAGEVVACLYVKQACQRYLDDLEHAADRGLVFDADEAARPSRFSEACCKHSKGAMAGNPVAFEPFEHFISENLFGWYFDEAKTLRRFSIALIDVARKNGKSQLAAVFALYLAFYDNEPGAEVYTAATNLKQAHIVFDESKRMAARNQAMRDMLAIREEHMKLRADTSVLLRPLASDAHSLDGLNVHAAIIDELHEHPDRKLMDVLITGTGTRERSMIVITTTRGASKESVLGHEESYCIKILAGEVTDETRFAFIATLDDTDDWTDEPAWIKANPGLDTIKSLPKMRQKVELAKLQPHLRGEVKRKELNLWADDDVAPIPLTKWDACAEMIDWTEYHGSDIYVAFDLSAKSDLTAMAWCIEQFGDYLLGVTLYCPLDRIHERSERDRVEYARWHSEGHIQGIPGGMIRPAQIYQDFRDLASDFNVKMVAVDPWETSELVGKIEDDGHEVVQITQTFKGMGPPTRHFLDLIHAGRMRHENNPCMRWMASNVVLNVDGKGNVQPMKGKSKDKIDGVVASIMALAVAPDESTLTDNDGDVSLEDFLIIGGAG